MPMRSFHKFLFLLAGLIPTCSLQAQVPQGISYQAVARQMPDGDELPNTPLTVRIRVLNQSQVLEYEETHSTTSNAFGLVNLVIGQGVATGNGLVVGFDEINWASGSHYVEVGMIYPGVTEFQTVGSSELLSVPYALVSQSSTSITEQDGDTTNELITSMTYDGTSQTLTIDEGGLQTSVVIPSGDASESNELITSFELTGDGQTLSITEAGTISTVNMEPIMEATWQEDNGHVYNTTEQIGIGTNTPSSTLQVNGSYAASVEVVVGTAIVNLDETDQVIICNVTDGPVTVNLPDAAVAGGRIYTIRKTYNENLNPFTSNSVSFQTVGGDLIDFNASYMLNWVKQETVSLISNGTQWYVLNYTRDEI
jgi:hypothetical protein